MASRFILVRIVCAFALPNLCQPMPQYEAEDDDSEEEFA